MSVCDPKSDLRVHDRERPPRVDSSRSRSSHFGQKWSLAEASRNVRFPIRKETFEPTVAAQNDLLAGYVRIAIAKQKQLVDPDIISC